MRRDEFELLQDVEALQTNQIYLMEPPATPQQQFLHLFAHRHLLSHKMIHKNIERCLGLLPGSHAHTALHLAYASLCLDNKLETSQVGSPALLALVTSWVGYYPSIQGRSKVLLGEIVLQESTSPQEIQGFHLYLHYLDLISQDLWRVLRGGGEGRDSSRQFLSERPLKEEMGDWRMTDLGHLDPSDLLTFISSCIPKTLLNIVLDKASLPAEMRSRYSRLECLYCNEAVESELRGSVRLSVLLKNILLVLLQMELSVAQSKFLMMVAMRYYYVYHHSRRFSAAEVIIYAFNKLTDEVRRTLTDEFSLFAKIILKLGKHKFTAFLAQNSPFMRAIIEAMRKKPVIGYPQEAASPYNTIGIGEPITIDRGSKVHRYFEVLEEFSIFYYRIMVVSLDVDIRLHYLGEVGAAKASKTLLFSQEKKSGTVKNCINAMKKGLYMFEFDNSSSWINSKALHY